MLHALPFADVSRLLHVFVGPSISSLVLCLAHIAYKQDMSINGSFDAMYTSIYRLRSCSAFSLHGNTLPWNTMMGVTSCEHSIATFSRNRSTYLGNPTNRTLRQFFLRSPPPSCHGLSRRRQPFCTHPLQSSSVAHSTAHAEVHSSNHAFPSMATFFPA